MRTVTQAEFLADSAAAFRIADHDGSVGILGEDGKISMTVHCPKARLEDPEVVEERNRILTRLLARATAEQLTADRWAQGGDDRMVTIHTKVAEVLREECDRLESGV